MAQYRNKRKDHVYEITDYLLGKLPGEDFSHHRLWNCPILGEVEHVKDLGNDGIIIFGTIKDLEKEILRKRKLQHNREGVTRQERGQDQLLMSTF